MNDALSNKYQIYMVVSNVTADKLSCTAKTWEYHVRFPRCCWWKLLSYRVRRRVDWQLQTFRTSGTFMCLYNAMKQSILLGLPWRLTQQASPKYP